MPERFQQITRRNLLKGAGATAALAALSPVPNLYAQDNQLEVFSWWAGSDGGPALDAIFSLYNEMYPDVEIVNSVVAGGSGINARAVLKTRMLGGDPPDSFQVHAGNELIGTWVIADRLQDLTPLFEAEGLTDVFPDELVQLISTNEGIWSMPLTIHRSNVLWYAPSTLNDLGIEPPATWDEFLEMAPAIQEQGITPLSVARNWTVQHLWESVALAELGPEKWQALFDRELEFTSPEAVRTWERLDEILSFTNADEDASSLSWQQAVDRIANGNAAFNLMGDWAAGYMEQTLELTPETGFAWAPSPGTDGQFQFLSDSFPLPKNPPHPENARNWLALVGSKQGSDAFNPKKGSISPRLDSDTSLYSVYSQSAAEDFRNDTLAGSLVHGIVANENFMSNFADVMSIFLDTRDPQRAANAAEAVAATTNLGEI